MMFWPGGGYSGWGWVAMIVGMLLFWVVVIGGGVLLFRALNRPPAPPSPPAGMHPTPEQVLADRYARGEIDEDEYRRRLATLRGRESSPTG